jgi:uncharacterized protein (DUF488 family)
LFQVLSEQSFLENTLASNPIYTIGYGNRSIEEFIELLKRYGIQYLVDIRSQPYSRYNPDFSKDALAHHLKQQQIRYIYMGDTLGGRPADTSCYLDGQVDYAKVREKAFYQKGISYIQSAWQRQLSIALMCSEAKPQECHRGKLIGNTLIEQHIEVAHIDEAGNTKVQEAINQSLIGEGKTTDDQPALPGLEMPLTQNEKIRFSRKKYAPTKESA